MTTKRKDVTDMTPSEPKSLACLYDILKGGGVLWVHRGNRGSGRSTLLANVLDLALSGNRKVGLKCPQAGQYNLVEAYLCQVGDWPELPGELRKWDVRGTEIAFYDNVDLMDASEVNKAADHRYRGKSVMVTTLGTPGRTKLQLERSADIITTGGFGISGVEWIMTFDKFRRLDPDPLRFELVGKSLTAKRRGPCTTCDGTGEIPMLTKMADCPDCGGGT